MTPDRDVRLPHERTERPCLSPSNHVTNLPRLHDNNLFITQILYVVKDPFCYALNACTINRSVLWQYIAVSVLLRAMYRTVFITVVHSSIRVTYVLNVLYRIQYTHNGHHNSGFQVRSVKPRRTSKQRQLRQSVTTY